MFFVALAFGFCAYTEDDWAYLGKIIIDGDGKKCETLIVSDGQAEFSTEIDGHEISVSYLGNGEAKVTVDGMATYIGPPL